MEGRREEFTVEATGGGDVARRRRRFGGRRHAGWKSLHDSHAGSFGRRLPSIPCPVQHRKGMEEDDRVGPRVSSKFG